MSPLWIWATRLRYALSKTHYSTAESLKRYHAGEIRIEGLAGRFYTNFFEGKLTSMHFAHNDRGDMVPTIHKDGATVLVRKLLDYPSPIGVFVGDVVVIKNPEDPSQLLIRRLAAVEGCEMVSTDEKDEPFILARNHCWVLADNQSLTPKMARDSRLFGPVPLGYIYGRVIYTLRTTADHARATLSGGVKLL
ncbi:unnamed protein product [Urochloa decumbens]|uniref:Mitochondrial inner membrane protease subunit 1 n=1 Tax=Urochloa decumbens TaxID=240449 RepID=A0ABC9CG31_9POAL